MTRHPGRFDVLQHRSALDQLLARVVISVETLPGISDGTRWRLVARAIGEHRDAAKGLTDAPMLRSFDPAPDGGDDLLELSVIRAEAVARRRSRAKGAP